MDMEILRRVILEYQDIVSQIQLVKRPFTFEEHGNYVFVGIRQAGKSYLLYQQAQQLLQSGHAKEEFVYVNFDDERINNIRKDELDLIIQAHLTLNDHQPILFLDEIQNVEGWEHFVRRLANQKYQVYVTGSNAKMLSRDIATVLGGRFWIQNVFTYSFAEYLEACQIPLRNNWQSTRQREKIAQTFNTYFYYGGFPELVNVTDKRSWLNGIYKKILFNDVIVRNGIRNEEALRMTIRRLADCVKQPTSYNRICNLVKSTGINTNVQTVISYVKYLRESCLIFALENYASKFVEKETVKKHYFIDNGLLNIFLTDPDTSLLENLCAIHLYQKYGEDLYFYNKDIEVDFLVPAEGMAIQACFRMGDDETTKREVLALEKIDKALDIQHFLIITRDQEDTIITKSGKTIRIIPIWKWLLE